VPEDKAVKKTSEKPLKDSEGLRVSTVKDEVAKDEDIMKASREAFEAELAADTDEEAKKQTEFEKFIAER